MFDYPIGEILWNFQWFQEFKNLIIQFSTFVKGNHSHTVFLETPLHVNTGRDVSKLPWHKYLKGQQSKNNQPLNSSASLSPGAVYMKYGTELRAGLCIIPNFKLWVNGVQPVIWKCNITMLLEKMNITQSELQKLWNYAFSDYCFYFCVLVWTRKPISAHIMLHSFLKGATKDRNMYILSDSPATFKALNNFWINS